MSTSRSVNPGGGSLRAIARAAFVASVAGIVWSGRAPLKAPVTVGGKTGNANLAVAMVGGAMQVTATAAIAAGTSQTIGWNATGADGCVQPWSLTLTGSYAIAAITSNVALSAAAGTVIAAITGVPAGQAPVLSPADGRFVIAGDEATGWKLARGMSAITIGTFNGAISAAGAISGAVNLTIVAASPYILDADFAGAAFSFNDVAYPDEASFLAAVGGTVASGKYIIGPYAPADGANLVINGTADDATGWLAGQVSGGPASVAAVSGAIVMSSAVAANRPMGYSMFPVQPGKCYGASARIAKGADASTNPKFSVTHDVTNVLGAVAGSSLVSAATLTAVPVRTFSACAGYANMGAGALLQSSAATGSASIDDLLVKEYRPFNGWSDGVANGIVDFILPAASAVDQVIINFDDNALDGVNPQIRNYVQIVLDSSGHLRGKVFAQTVLGSGGTLQRDIDLGVLSVGPVHTAHFLGTAGALCISIDGANAVPMGVDNFPGIGVIRLGRSQVAATNDFAGTIRRLRIFREITVPPGMSTDSGKVNGDSYSGLLTSRMGLATGAVFSNVGSGGTTVAQQVGFITARPATATQRVLDWDGASNGYTDAAAYLADLDAKIAASGGPGNIVMGFPLKRSSTSNSWAMDDAIEAGIRARLTSAHWVDALAILKNHGNGSANDNADIANDCCPRSLVDTSGHLINVAMDYVVNDPGGFKEKWLAIK